MTKERKVKLMIVDDDEASLNSIRNTVTYSFPDFQIVAQASNVKDALKLLEESEPELLILDIMLPDGYGFDILQLTTYKNFEVIITSSHPNYALQAFNYSALHFLEKPVSIEKLGDAFSRYQSYNSFEQIDSKIKIAKELLNKEHASIMLPFENGMSMHNLDEITTFDSENNYVKVCFSNGKSEIICRQLNRIEEILEGTHFCRVHNSHIVNLKQIKSYHRGKNPYIVLKNQRILPLSNQRRDDFLEKLDNYAKII